MQYLAGVIITFFLAVILMTKKGNTAADHVLAVWLCVIGFHLFLFYMQITGGTYDHAYLLGIQIPLPLLQGPLLYLYTLTVTGYQGFLKKYWLHFIPVVLAYAALYEFFWMSSAEKINVYKNEGAGFEVHTGIILVATIISGFTYVVLSFYELRKYKKRITDEFSNTEKINLNWLRYLIYSILVIWIIILLNGDDPMIFGAVVIFVFFLGYFGIKHMGIFTYQQIIIKEIAQTAPGKIQPAIVDERIVDSLPGTISHMKDDTITTDEEVSAEDSQEKTKYERSGLQKDAADKMYNDLTLLMETKKVFKNEELSLAELARLLQVHPNSLSQVINTYEKKNFYDYINTLRIEEFKALVTKKENQQYTLLSLAFECGFNSKTAFNRNFKKITGSSPTAYLKEINIQIP